LCIWGCNMWWSDWWRFGSQDFEFAYIFAYLWKWSKIY
jgi:hypothetical protein